MKLKFAVAALMAAASFGASAADQTIELTLGGDNFFTSVVDGADGVLSGGADVLTFTGLQAGVYNISIDLSGQNIKLDFANTTLNGAYGDYFLSSGKMQFWGIESTGASPFVLNLAGTALDGAKYSGSVSVSAVPEPTTYGMLLGGLGIMGFLARRKSKQA